MDAEDVLVRRARQSDREAFEEQVRRTSRLVYARLYLETGDAHLAEDLVQETYLRAWRSIEQVMEADGFRKWLFTVAHSAMLDAYRRENSKRRAAPFRRTQEVVEETPAEQEERPEVADQRERVRKVLQSLPEDYRMPLMLRYLDGADYESITLQLGLSNGSLRGLLHRGLKLLRGALDSENSHESR